MKKGVGLIARLGFQISELPKSEYRWVVPFQIGRGARSVRVVAVWACKVGSRKRDNYVGQVYGALKHHPEWFSDGPTVVAGDFNSNAIWDRERPDGNHSSVVELLNRYGLVSAYHFYYNEAHGAETRPTSYLYRNEERPFHIDYIFIPKDWCSRIASLEVGSHADWSELSDHSPLILDLE
jgi:endonuclease/exonuclease/phosphatase family metal-dependent hydrolase